MRRAASFLYDDRPSEQPFPDSSKSAKPQPAGTGAQDAEKSRPVHVPACPQTVRELFNDEAGTPQWGFPLFLGGDLDDFVTTEELWQVDVSRGKEGLHRGVDATPPEAVVLVHTQTPTQPQTQTQTRPQTRPQTRTPAIESRSTHLAFAKAIHEGLKAERRDAFKELREPPNMSLADLLTAASERPWRRAKDYLCKADSLHKADDPVSAQAFTLLFLAAGTMTLESAASYGLNPFHCVSHEVIQRLDERSRQILQSRWKTAPDGPLRALVMGPEAAEPLAVETEPLPIRRATAASGQQAEPSSNGVRQGLGLEPDLSPQGPGAGGSQTAPWPDVLTTLAVLVTQGIIKSSYVIELIDSSLSLSDLARGAGQLDAVAANCVLSAATTLRRRGELAGARYLALVFLMTRRTPQKAFLKEYTLNQLISHDEATSLCDQFGLELDLSRLL